MIKSLTTFYPFSSTISVPAKLTPYKDLIDQEYQWLIYIMDSIGRRRTMYSRGEYYYLFAIDRVLTRLYNLHQMTYWCVYDFCNHFICSRKQYLAARRNMVKGIEKYKKTIID